MSKNQIIKNTREVGKTTYLYNLVIQSINNGLNVIVLDSATEHEDKSLLKKVAKKYPNAKVIECRDETKVATYEELNKGLDIFEFPYYPIKNKESNIILVHSGSCSEHAFYRHSKAARSDLSCCHLRSTGE